ncbi:hypothetical protein F5Y03DRAFT_343906 [Xylaria venustula]|nr:hypothetical protein F5Y03DRAFT_343906 [Xylaria venustula]
MPDHYVVLGIQQTATPEEITSAYRRLAMIHHPDRNPGDIAGATERFQRIQQAHGILSDNAERRRYDASRNTPSPRDASSNGGERTHGRHPNDTEHSSWSFHWLFNFGRVQVPSQADREAERWRLWQEQQRQRQKGEAMIREQRRRREQELKAIIREQERQRREREETRKQLRRAAKEAEQAEADATREVLLARETRVQKARWDSMGAVAEEERIAACLHSGFCKKTSYTRKLKCGACSVKRGMILFECPHCALEICQLCVTNFTEARAEAS